MQKVYVVKVYYDEERGYEFWDENPCIIGIYSTIEKADKRIGEYLSQFNEEYKRLLDCQIEEWELDV